MSIYKVPAVETKDDIIKKIEIEYCNLVYFNYMKKEEAWKEARESVENKYKDVVEKLKAEGKY